MKIILVIVVCAFLISCTGTATNSINDSIPKGMTEIEFRDSIMKDLKKSAAKSLLDTEGMYKSPVKVLSAVLFKKEYSNYRDIRLSYKNVSTKTIAAIKFKWYGTNAFGEPADMGRNIIEGFGGGFTDDPLPPNKKETSEWSILSRDGKKVELAWPYEVVFVDGTKWELKK